jgi:pimeloyl-ACP methyl ester carboxylesterase
MVTGHPIERAARALLRAAGVRSRYVETAVARHHVYDAPGQGRLPTIAFLPGLSDSGASLAPVLLRLRRRVRRVLIVESAGHGLSPPAHGEYTMDRHLASMGAALDRLLDEPAVLAGNSLGGATALRYAVDRPTRVRGLYLTSPGGAALDDATLDDLRRAFAIRTTAEARAFLDRVITRPGPAAPLLARLVRARAASPDVTSLLRTLDAHHRLTPDELARLAAPVTVLWGRAERLLPPAALAYFREHLPAHATILEPAGLGHCPHLDDPRRLAQLLAAFAAQVGAAPHAG